MTQVKKTIVSVSCAFNYLLTFSGKTGAKEMPNYASTFATTVAASVCIVP